ncbi:hypothetical protein FB466_0520 [Klugiella xanthotipulae]|uniref:Uncharacterized protein n=1 Tax=Klugiella xanthotipulae TaxID=244735 RepID=A0A543I537_9MICO|nr:hypothetical protein FB466_0520 [Klugiella xanthotipulae]
MGVLLVGVRPPGAGRSGGARPGMGATGVASVVGRTVWSEWEGVLMPPGIGAMGVLLVGVAGAGVVLGAGAAEGALGALADGVGVVAAGSDGAAVGSRVSGVAVAGGVA